VPHRHYSHLFSIWPLHLLDLTNETQSTTARNSINLWLATPEEDSMFYRPAASAMNVLLNNNAAAFDNVTYLLNHRIEGSTWYREGQAGSCTETPYAGAWAMIDWMVQSWNTTMAAAGPGNGGREDTKRTVIDFFPASMM
jgi:alpha-L-fucosidase 2